MNTIDHERLLARFLRYVQVDTTANPSATTYPSSPGQLELGRVMVDELRAIGLSDVVQDSHGIVTATLPSNVPHNAPTIAFCAHLDTSPETSGQGVKPQVWRKYPGGDLPLSAASRQVIRVADSPKLAKLIGQTIITSDGTTLLGADDKAGLAAIVEALAYLAEHPEIPHGAIRACFTCDEEIGHGVDHIDVPGLGATVCYTLDGSGTDQIANETFSADLATVIFRGVNIHPAIAYGRMINAVRAVGVFLDRLPRTARSPETTCDRQGFLHPYHIDGGVAQTTVQILLRDFDTPKLAESAELLRQIAATVIADFPGLQIDVQITEQYRNLADGLEREPRAVAHAVTAHRRLGREPELTIVRGGTDGSRLTELGLPTPNLSTGEHNAHAPIEWSCLEEIAQAAELVVELARVWGEPS